MEYKEFKKVGQRGNYLMEQLFSFFFTMNGSIHNNVICIMKTIYKKLEFEPIEKMEWNEIEICTEQTQ